MNKTQRIALAVALVAVIVGVLLGLFLPRGEEEVQVADIATDQAPPAEVAAPEGEEAVPAADEAAPAADAVAEEEAREEATEEATVAAVEMGKEPLPAPSELVEEAVAPDEEPEPEELKVDRLREAEPPAAVELAPEQNRAKVETRERPDDLEPAVEPPTFDVVRVTPEGDAIIAGRAEPGAEVSVREGEREIATAIADDRGEWVVVPEEPLESGDRALSLVETLPSGEAVESEQLVIVSIPEEPAPGTPTEVARLGEEPAAGEPAAEAAPEEERRPLAVLAERAGKEPSRVLQGPSEAVEPEAEVSIESVDYDDAGEMTLAGQAEPGASVNVYVDEEYVGTAEADEEGEWQLEPGDKLEPGTHRVRVDKVDREGVVLARIETPLARAAPEQLLLGDALVVVQPGNSLWRIARRAYGGGVHFTVIYEANRGQIRDPNLIYPGQIFAMPVVN